MGKLKVTLEFECDDDGELYGDAKVYDEDGFFMGEVFLQDGGDDAGKYSGWVNAGKHSGFLGFDSESVFAVIDAIVSIGVPEQE